MNIICDCCSIKVLTFIAALTGFIQAMISLGISSYYCDLYLSDYIPKIIEFPLWAILIRGVTIDFDDTMKGLIPTVAVMSSIWVVSSFVLVAGNIKNRVIFITQWIIVTVVITVFDIIFMIYFLTMTSDVLGNIFSWEEDTQDLTKADLVRGYIWMLYVFGKFGIFFWLLNLYLAYIVYRRATILLESIRTEKTSNSYITLGTKSVQFGSNNSTVSSLATINEHSKIATGWSGTQNATKQSRLQDNRGYVSDGVCY